MNFIPLKKIIASGLGLAATAMAFAHVVLDEPAVLAGHSYRAVLRVGHGCDGAATQGLKAPAALLEVIPSEAAGHQH